MWLTAPSRDKVRRMVAQRKLRIFISYARKDGASLAQRLRADLANEGFDAWLDNQRIAGGAVWTKVIEQALDNSDVVLALLTTGSYVSEICRAEQLRALRNNKCVIPIRAQSGTEIIPLHLETKNYRDFTNSYESGLNALITDIGQREGVVLKNEYRETYVTAPPLPPNYIERPEALEALREAIITEGGGRNIAVTRSKVWEASARACLRPPCATTRSCSRPFLTESSG
jgi:TIR domain